MPRIRYLKPDFFTDEDLSVLSHAHRLAFAGLWCYADKQGRLEYRPMFLKAMIFPYEEIDMEKILNDIKATKQNGGSFIEIYTVDNKKYIQISNWGKHQKPHHTEKESVFPAPPSFMEKGMEKGMGMENQLKASGKLNNGEVTVKGNNNNNPDNLQNNPVIKQTKAKKFIPPTIEEVKAYFEENGYTEASACRTWQYYEDGNPPWTDSKGNQVRSWKQKIRANWFKPENEKPSHQIKPTPEERQRKLKELTS